MSDISYFQTELSSYFPPLPIQGALSCKHLPMAIIYGRPEEELNSLIDKCTKTVKRKFSQIKDITTLHLAALFGRSETIEKLCSKVTETLPKDAEGNTPLHLRALSTESPLDEDLFYQNYFIECLLNYSDHRVKNNAGATADDLIKMKLAKNTPSFSERFSFLSHQFKTNEESQRFLVDLSQNISIEKGCLNPNVHFVDQMVASSKALFDQWLYGIETLSPIDKSPKSLYRFVIKQIPGKGCGVVAREDIPKGELLFPYLGELFSQQKGQNEISLNGYDYHFLTQETDHKFFKIDAFKYRGIAAYINDGINPNVETLHLTFYPGLKDVIYYQSEGIKKGDELTVDYSLYHPLKYSLSYSLSEKEFNEVKSIIDKGKPPFEEVFSSSENPISRIYLNILKTPPVFFKLAAQGVVLPRHLAKIIIKRDQYEDEFILYSPQLIIAYLIAKSKEKIEAQKGGASYFKEVVSYLSKAKEQLLNNKSEASIDEIRFIFFSLFLDGFSKLYKDIQTNMPLEEAIHNFGDNFKVNKAQFDLDKRVRKFSEDLNGAFKKAFPEISEDSFKE